MSQKVFAVLYDLRKCGFTGNKRETCLFSDTDDLKSNIRRGIATLRNGDDDNESILNYWTKAEAEDFCENVKILDPATSSYLKTVTAQAFSVGKVIEHADKKKELYQS